MEPLHIAVCEDSAEDREMLLAVLGQSKIRTDLAAFASGEDFLSTYSMGRYDLLLMDIYMGGMSGIEVVHKIRQTDELLVVAFITVSADYALESYRLNALKYIEKPLQKKPLLELLELTQLKKENTPRLLLKKDGKDISTPFPRILYAEQKDRTLLLHLWGGEVLQVNGRLDDLELEFAGQPFFRCHKSFLVNLAHVARLDRELALFEMSEGKSVYIRRESLGKVKKAYEAYLFDVTRGLEE